MIKSASLQTEIIDDIDLAVNDLASQLIERLPLLRNSVGIVQCDPEFIEAGIMPLLHDALGIPLVGGSTVSLATNGGIGNYMFCVLVLTSDDIDFFAGHTTGLIGGYEASIAISMQEAISASKQPLQLALIFPTLKENKNISGDRYLEAAEKACGDVPVFGTLSVDDTLRNFERSISVCNGDAFTDEMTYVLLFGVHLNPRFFVATVPEAASLMETRAIVTKSDGNIVREINNMLAVKYFESIELAENGNFREGVQFVPFLVTDRGKGGVIRTFVRALISFDENGHVAFRGKVPEGSILSVASLNADDILDATSEVMKQIADIEDVQAVMVFSCIIRQLCIGADPLKELAQIKDALRPDVAFIASCSGGEISPVRCGCGCDGRDKPLNTFHNYSLIACLL